MASSPKPFKVHGPFEIPLEPKKHGKMVAKDLAGFWSRVGDIRASRGVYVFAMRAGKGFTPIYVGKAAEQSFEDEAFANHKLADHYNPALLDYKKGNAVMFFVVHPTMKGAVAKKAIDEIETFLIDTASVKNPMLSNVRKKPKHTWRICGVLRPERGEASRSTGSFKMALGLP